MYRGKGNTAAKPRRAKLPSPEKRALYIAESIQSKILAGVAWNFEMYGIAEKADMLEMVRHHLKMD